MRSILTAAQLLTANLREKEPIVDPVVVIEDGVVTAITTQSEAGVPGGELVSFPGATLAPAL